MEDSTLALNDYTVVKLKDFLHYLGLKTTGSKAELVQRLTDANKQAGRDATYVPDILDEPQYLMAHEEIQQDEVREAANVRPRGTIPRETTRGIPDEAQREIDLLRRERDLLERELSLVRRETNASPLTASSSGGYSVASSMSIRAIGDLLSEFHGDDTFWKWEKQVQLLRTTYNLDDNATRVLISSRLKDKALGWFHSKPDHLQLSVDNLINLLSFERNVRFTTYQTDVAKKLRTKNMAKQRIILRLLSRQSNLSQQSTHRR